MVAIKRVCKQKKNNTAFTYTEVADGGTYTHNFVENEELFEISRWTNGTWILHNVSNVRWRILKKRTLIHWSNGQLFLVINSKLFLLYSFSKFLYIFTLFIHPSIHNLTNITPNSHDDGSAEPKHYSVDFVSL